MPHREMVKMAGMPAIRKWVVCIAGFLQDEGTPGGLVAVWRELHRLHAAPDVRVEFRAWNARARSLAELIWRLRPAEDRPQIVICAYSWGGASAQNLAKQLGRRGLVVDRMVLADPVYRHGYWCGNWRALVPWSRIVVPHNVRRVAWFRQTVSRPRGHDLVAEDPDATTIEPPEVVKVDHTYIDDLRAFHDSAIAAAGVV